MERGRRRQPSPLFGHEIASLLDWARVLEEGFPHQAVHAAIEHGVVSREEAEHRVIPHVPSSAAAEERNTLIDPAHPDADRIRIVDTTPFELDPGLLDPTLR